MKARVAFCVIMIGQAAVLSSASAQNTLTVPSELAYVSNPALAPDDRRSVTLLRVNPQYTIRKEEGGSTTEFAFGGLLERSSNTDLSANRSLPRASVRWQNVDARSLFEIRGSLEEESTRTTQFADFGRVTLDSTSRTGLLGTRWTRELSSTSLIDLSAIHRRVNYETAALVDFNETQGEAMYAVQSGPNARYSVTLRAGHLDFAGPQRSASLAGLRLGYERNLSDRVVLNAMAGAVRVNSPRDDTHAVGNLRVSYEGERLGYSAAWSREVGASGVGGYERTDAIDLAMTYPLSATSTLSLGLGRARSLGTGDVGSSAYGRVRTELTRFWSWTTGLEFRQASPTGRASAHGYSLVVGLVYENPDF